VSFKNEQGDFFGSFVYNNPHQHRVMGQKG